MISNKLFKRLLCIILLPVFFTCILPTEEPQEEEKTIEYSILLPSFPGNSNVATTFSGSFNILNSGTGNGTNPITWKVYLSSDNVFQTTDTEVDTGFVTGITASNFTEVSFTGTWPDTAANYYLIIVITGTDIVATTQVVSSAITVSEGSGPVEGIDYVVFGPSYPVSSNVDSNYSGAFYIRNNGTGNGADTVYWKVYLSSDNVYQNTDTEVGSGQKAALAASALTKVDFTGTWPSTAGDYYLIVVLTAADDGDTTNNQDVSSAITISVGSGGGDSIDYFVLAPLYPGDSNVDSSLNGSFYIQNKGTLSGAQPVDWKVYLSTDNVYQNTDTQVDSGQIAALAASASSQVTFSGTWPSTAGDYYLIVVLTATDDDDTTNNQDVSSAITVAENIQNAGVDYSISSITYPNDAQVDTAISGSFYIVNSGATDGSASVSWSVYRSSNNTYEAGTDQTIDTGLISGLTASNFSEVTFSGTWPSTAGSYYVIIVVTATDDADTTNNTQVSNAITISEVPVIEYSITNATYPSSGIPSAQFDGSFKITNNGGANGSADIAWNVYLSSDATLEPGTDTVVGSGTQSALIAGSLSPFIPYSGTWPSEEGSYYIFVVIYATDDSDDTNNEDSDVVAIAPVVGVDYNITSQTFPTSGVIGLGYSGSFRIQNVGSSNGSFTPSWTVYRSDDDIYDVGDSTVQAGVFSGPLASGAISEEVSFSGTWPSTAGDYYIIIKVTASEDIDTTNNQLVSSAITVTEVVDYTISNESFPASGALSGTYSGSFKIDNIGTVDGSSNISWEVFRSSNSTLDGSDTSVDSGSISALIAGASSAAIGYSGAWPATAANYYLIIEITSSEDSITTNNQVVSSVISIIDSGRFVVVGDNATIKYSDDGGTTWSSALVSPTTTVDLNKVTTNGSGLWVACGDSALLYYSIDNGVTWQPGVKGASVTATGTFYDIEYQSGKWLIVSDNGILVYSTDGINWEMVDTPAYTLQAITWDDTYNRWYASNTGNGYGFYIEYDAETGVPYSSGSMGSSTGGFYAVIDNNQTSPTRLIGAGYSKYRYSDDGGVSWLDATSKPTHTHYIGGLAYDGNITWVAVGYSPSTISYSINAGVDWTQASSYDSSEYYYDVTYDSKSGRFVAVGVDGIISYSSDGGSTWTRAANTGTILFRGVAVGP